MRNAEINPLWNFRPIIFQKVSPHLKAYLSKGAILRLADDRLKELEDYKFIVVSWFMFEGEFIVALQRDLQLGEPLYL